MNKSNRSCLLVAIAATLGAVLPANPVAAQAQSSASSTIRLPAGSLNPFLLRRNITLAPALTACGRSAGYGVTMGPCQGPTGTSIRVQLSQSLSGVPVYLSFKAVVSRGVPARITTRLGGSGSNYATQAPVQLCIQGGGTWEAELILSNGQNIGTIGSFTPTNCPR